jgi:hypothetical protein
MPGFAASRRGAGDGDRRLGPAAAARPTMDTGFEAAGCRGPGEAGRLGAPVDNEERPLLLAGRLDRRRLRGGAGAGTGDADGERA